MKSIHDVNDYQTRAMRTAVGEGQAEWIAEFVARIGNEDGARLVNAALGLSGEAGEFADHVKKWAFQFHDLDADKAKSELGDIAWYLAQASQALHTYLSTILGDNIQKLERRYPSGKFSTERSIHR